MDRLGRALRDEGIVYCQWKGHFRRDHWASGEGDIDLLVDPASAPAFAAVLGRLGFTPVMASPAERIPGVESFLGYDPRVTRLLHVHAHYRLVVGRAWATHFRLPIERLVLDSAVERAPFPAPAPEVELIVFVLRTLLARSPGYEIFGGWAGHARPLEAIQDELRYLVGQSNRPTLHALLRRHLPCVEPGFFDLCLSALRPGFSRWRRALVERRLAGHLRAHARRAPGRGILRRLAERLLALSGARRAEGARLARGGTTIALVGGDGAGKSTCVAELSRWLAPALDMTTAHLGRPPRSLLTLAVGALLKLRNALWVPWPFAADPDAFPGYVALLREVCTARDRYRLYVKTRRLAAAGGLVLAERYPIPENRPLAGPTIHELAAAAPNQRLAGLLRKAEEWYYRQILPPDRVIVLLVDPEVAVRRKTTEPPDYVRRRARIVSDVDWAATGARVVDAGRPLSDVLAELKAVVWSAL